MQRFVPLTQAPFGVAGLGEPVLRWVLSGVAVLGDEAVKADQVSLGCVLSCSANIFPGRRSNGSDGEQNYGLGLFGENLR